MFWVLYILAADAVSSASQSINWNATVTGILALVGTVMTGVFAVMMARINSTAKEAKDVAASTAKEAKETAASTAVVIGKIETEGNSKTTKMEAELKELRRELSEVKEAKATLVEQKRGQETKDAVAAALAPTPSQISSVTELSPTLMAEIIAKIKKEL